MSLEEPMIWSNRCQARTSGLAGMALVATLTLFGLAGCGGEEPPRLSDAGPPAAAPPSRWKPETQGAMLVATGRQAFEGRSASRCVLHDKDGLQINLRTGDPDLPAVAVRIDEFHGSGPYRARLFVTGRSRSGALVGSTGEVTLEMQQRESPGRAGGAEELPPPPVVLSGSFEGAYDGQAGRGSVHGRFGGCSYASQVSGSPGDSVRAQETTRSAPTAP